MIESLTHGNFRAFKSQQFYFSKLNIFVGPNNSGKSSAISALNVLAQTMAGSVVGASPIVLNGQFDQLGTFKDKGIILGRELINQLEAREAPSISSP